MANPPQKHQNTLLSGLKQGSIVEQSAPNRPQEPLQMQKLNARTKRPVFQRSHYVFNNPLVNVDLEGLLTSDEAVKHYWDGTGSTVNIPFDDIPTDDVNSPIFFDKFNQLLKDAKKCSTVNVDVKGVHSTTGDVGLYIGDHTLRLQGTLKVDCNGNWTFDGTIKSYDDDYDFNPSTHRGPVGEILTRVGGLLPGKPFRIHPQGSKPIKGSGVVPSNGNPGPTKPKRRTSY